MVSTKTINKLINNKKTNKKLVKINKIVITKFSVKVTSIRQTLRRYKMAGVRKKSPQRVFPDNMNILDLDLYKNTH